MSPEPEVRSQRDPRRSVSLLGVVPSEAIFPTRFASFSLILSESNGFYYCDEHFSYIQSDIEKRIFGLMLDHLDKNEQLIFTTHNSDMLDLNLPKHSFAFLRKRAEEGYKVSVQYASEILKRNPGSVHCALENDMFASIPDDSLLNQFEKGRDDE